MAQIPKNDVFTNRAGTANQPDLLQQALQPVIDDEEQQNKYVITWVQSNENDTNHTTQMIPQAMIYEIKPAEEVMYEPCRNTNVVTDVPVSVSVTSYAQTPQQQSTEWTSQKSVDISQINFGPIEMQQDSATGSSAIQNDVQKWHAKESPQDTNLHRLVLNTLPVATPVKQSDLPDKHSPRYQISNGTIEQTNQSNRETAINTARTSKLRKYKTNENDKKLNKYSYSVQKTLAQRRQADNTKVTEEQILQKLPKILPSTTQDVIRSAQSSILQTSKNANMLRDSKTVPTIINNQVLNGANTVFAYTGNMSNQTVLTPYIPANIITNTSVPTSFATEQIHLPSTSNNNSVTLPNDLWKNIQVSTQLLNIPNGKDTVIVPELNQPTTKTNLKSPTVKKLKTLTKAPYQTTMKADPRSLLKSAQPPLAPTSLLKPGVKMILKNANNQSSISIPQLCNSQNGLNGTNALSNTRESKPSSQNIIYLVQNGTNLTSVLSLSDTELKVRQILEQHKRNNIEQPGAETKNCIVLCRIISLEDVGIKNPANANALSSTSIDTPKPLSNTNNNSCVVSEKNRVVKRGRPRKSAIQSSALVSQSPAIIENEQKEIKDNLMMSIARTRSGRLSRPPRHMISDYKRLPFEKHLACAQVDPDDSDGDYSRYITRNDKSEEQQESSTPLLNGLDVPKRNISDRFKCPTCCKYYLGQSRLLNHFENYPDHGSCEQLPPTPETVQNQNNIQDPLKRKGKKRGPWAYATPEAKSQRRMKKLEDALALCESEEITAVCAKVFDIQTTYGLLTRKVDSDLKSSLDQLKLLKDQIRKKVNTTLTLVDANEEKSKDMVSIDNDWFSEYLGINPGIYKINDRALDEEEPAVLHVYDNIEGAVPKIRKIDDGESIKKKNEEQMSSGESESSEHSVCEFLNEGRSNSATNSTCPDVLSALTLMPRNSHPITNTERSMPNNASNVLISSSEIQNRILDNPGFQKVNINTLKASVFEKSNSHNTFVDLNGSVEMSNDIQPFHDVEESYGQSTLDHMERAFRRLEPDDQTFDNSADTYQKEGSLTNIDQMRIKLDNVETESQSFAKQLHSPSSMRKPELNSIEIQASSAHAEKIVSSRSFSKILPSMPTLDEPVESIANNYENAFEANENLYLFPGIVTGVDKNLSMGNVHSANVNSADVSNIDEIVKERLQNIVIAENVLETNLSYNTNSYPDLNFEVLTTDFGNSINT